MTTCWKSASVTSTTKGLGLPSRCSRPRLALVRRSKGAEVHRAAEGRGAERLLVTT